jgi:hypothetical protein
MVLDLIAIGLGVYLFARHRKNKYVPIQTPISYPRAKPTNPNPPRKARDAAFAAGQPIYNRDGSITYPPAYSGCPTHGSGTGMRSAQPYDEKRQMQSSNESSVPPAAPAYRDIPEQQVPAYSPQAAPEKQAWTETREVATGEEKEYVKV